MFEATKAINTRRIFNYLLYSIRVSLNCVENLVASVPSLGQACWLPKHLANGRFLARIEYMSWFYNIENWWKSQRPNQFVHPGWTCINCSVCIIFTSVLACTIGGTSTHRHRHKFPWNSYQYLHFILKFKYSSANCFCMQQYFIITIDWCAYVISCTNLWGTLGDVGPLVVQI